MPSLADVANDIKALLTDIKASNAAIAVSTNQTANNVMTLNATSQAGFMNIAAGIAVEISLQQQANALLYENAQQNSVIICWLQNIAKVLCDIKHNTDISVQMETEINILLHHLNNIIELACASETLQVKKDEELAARINKCCPPEHPKPLPCYEACAAPQGYPYKPISVSWVPVTYNQPVK